MSNQNWNDPAGTPENPAQPPYGQPSAPEPQAPGYTAPDTTGTSPYTAPTYNAPTYSTPAYGTPEAPARTGISIADISAGMYAYSGILAALLQRGHTGQGTRVEVTMLEALAEWMSYPLNFSHYGGQAPVRSGLTHPTIAPYGQYVAGDGKGVIFGLQNDREWADFCHAVLQRPDLVDDPRFARNTLRVQHRAELDAVITQCLATLSREQVLQRLDAGGIANAPLAEPQEVWSHPQFAARQRWREVATPQGPIQALLPPATLSASEAAMGAVPALGEHTEAILRELGFAP